MDWTPNRMSQEQRREGAGRATDGRDAQTPMAFRKKEMPKWNGIPPRPHFPVAAARRRQTYERPNFRANSAKEN